MEVDMLLRISLSEWYNRGYIQIYNGGKSETNILCLNEEIKETRKEKTCSTKYLNLQNITDAWWSKYSNNSIFSNALTSSRKN